MDENSITPETRSHRIRARPIRDQTRQTDLLAIAKERALAPDIFDEHPPFFWEAEFSNDLLDAYFTHMNERTLTNYAVDAQTGIAFLRGHNWHDVPVGQSLSGRLEEHEGRRRVLADFFTITGLPETDDLVWRMKSGVARDVSVGFHGGREICDICGNNYWSWDCRHIAGLKYETEEDGVVRLVLATVEIDDAHAAEVSAVYDGATPQAEITKARHLAEQGLLTGEQAGVLEMRYRTTLPAVTKQHAGADILKGQEEMELSERVQALLDKYNIGKGREIPDALELLDTEIEQLRAAQADKETLDAQAADGRQYRSDLIAEALAEGVRAYGQEWDQESYKSILEPAPLSTIKRMRDDWAKVAGKRFPGGRQTEDGDGDAPEGDKSDRLAQLVSDAAYSS